MNKIGFNVDNVIGQLVMASSVISSKNTIAILNDLVVCTYNNRKQAIVTASDSEVWLDIKIQLTEDNEGDDFSFAIDAKDFVSTLRNLSGNIVTLELDYDAHVVNGKYGNGKFQLPFESADDYPKPVVNTGNENVYEKIVDVQKFTSAISYTRFATAVNEVVRPIMNGINFNFNEEMMSVSATNTAKMSVYDDFTVKGDSCNFTMPCKTANIILQMTQKMDGEVKLTIGERNIVVSRSEFRMTSILQEGNFPDCKRVIPKENPISFSINRQDLLKAIKRVLHLGSQTSARVDVSLTNGMLTVSAKNSDFSKAASEDVKCDYSGDDFAIAFNGSNMVATIDNFTDENLVIGMSLPKKAAVVVPEKQDESYECTCLLMPMIL